MNIKNLICASLMIFGLKNFFDLVLSIGFVDVRDSTVLMFEISLIAITSLQLYGLKTSNRWVWIPSSIQCVLIYFTSQGTFGYFFSYMLKPFVGFQPTQSYLIVIFLVISEIFKTAWLYKNVKNLKA